jgi:hypothetical protein
LIIRQSGVEIHNMEEPRAPEIRQVSAVAFTRLRLPR